MLLTLPWPARAVTREELTCPVRKDWKEESEECPCEKGWKPTEKQLKEILDAHNTWLERGGWNDPALSGRALFCGARLKDANLEGSDLTFSNFEYADLQNANLKDAILVAANLQGANLLTTNLKYANLYEADLEGANLYNANLERASLGEANVQGADLRGANLQGTDLIGANLQGAKLLRANLEAANLLAANVKDAAFAFANLSRTLYAPASPPPGGYLEGIQGLASVTFPPEQYSGLVQLRELLQKAGLRDLEREATFAIEHNKAVHARQGSSLINQLGGWLQLIFFEWTTGWGLYPSRALAIVLGLLVFLGVAIYPGSIAAAPEHASRRHGIFKVYLMEEHDFPEGRVRADEVVITRLTAGPLASFGYGLWFSVLSAFHIGWRDLNFGTWLSRIQPFPFALRARGWVRIVSGLQSLVSVYLVAMWALTYFGRPFQ